jgi:hypothetical protein
MLEPEGGTRFMWRWYQLGLWGAVILVLISGYWATDQRLPFWAPTHIKSLVFYGTAILSVALAYLVLLRPR